MPVLNIAISRGRGINVSNEERICKRWVAYSEDGSHMSQLSVEIQEYFKGNKVVATTYVPIMIIVIWPVPVPTSQVGHD